MQYRMGRDFCDAKFIGPRVFDKFTVCILMMTLYWGIGNDYKPTNLINISALLYMWAILPGFAALTYVPSLVLERPLFIRYAHAAGNSDHRAKSCLRGALPDDRPA